MQTTVIDDAGHQLCIEAAKDWQSFVSEASTAGFSVRVNSAGRDPERQKSLYSAYVKAVAAWIRGGSIGEKPKPVAAPGRSEHERFTAVDVDMNEPGLLQWALRNSPKHNFYFTAARERWHLAWYPSRPPIHLYQRHEENVKRLLL